jgi:hypothetical protein
MHEYGRTHRGGSSLDADNVYVHLTFAHMLVVVFWFCTASLGS